MSIYADLLGGGWRALPESIRRLHENGGDGTFHIERHGIGRILPLPPAGAKVSIALRIVRNADGERWIRTFDGVHIVNSVQRARGGAITERFGAMTITMTLAASSGALRYHLVSARILGIPIPRRWLPRMVASELAEGRFVRMVVRFGEAFSYSGVMQPR